ncbi:50S ribosomal protein L16 [candidate division WOR-3 bacterium]|nr:50S ribosomal protein L16 [candidate division WOR-3 bacterium]
MLMPKRTRWRKQQRGRMKGKATSGSTIAFGDYGLMSLEPCWLTARQIEASRIVLAKKLRKHGKLWIRVFPDKPVSKKPLEVRMGKGKGAPEFWVAVVKPGRIIFELEGLPEDSARQVLKEASSKLPIRTKIVKREEGIHYEGF